MYVCAHTYRIFAELASEEVVESYFSRIDIRDGKIDLPNFKKFIAMLGSFNLTAPSLLRLQLSTINYYNIKHI